MLLRSNSPWRPAPRSGGKNSPGDCFSGRGRFPGFRSAVHRTVKRSPALYGSPCEKERSEKNALFLFSEILPMIGWYSILEIRQKMPSPRFCVKSGGFLRSGIQADGQCSAARMCFTAGAPSAGCRAKIHTSLLRRRRSDPAPGSGFRSQNTCRPAGTRRGSGRAGHSGPAFRFQTV